MAVNLSTAHLFTTVGVHPTRCGEFETPETVSPRDHLDQLLRLVMENREKVIAIGECGLGKEATTRGGGGGGILRVVVMGWVSAVFVWGKLAFFALHTDYDRLHFCDKELQKKSV